MNQGYGYYPGVPWQQGGLSMAPAQASMFSPTHTSQASFLPMGAINQQFGPVGGALAKFAESALIRPYANEALASSGMIQNGLSSFTFSGQQFAKEQSTFLKQLQSDMSDESSSDYRRINTFFKNMAQAQFGDSKSADDISEMANRSTKFTFNNMGLLNQFAPGLLERILPGGSEAGLATGLYDAMRMQGMSSNVNDANLKSLTKSLMADFRNENGSTNVGETRGMDMSSIGQVAQGLAQRGILGKDMEGQKTNIKSAVKAVDAMRVLLGDENAPVSELMAALDKLSGGLTPANISKMEQFALKSAALGRNIGIAGDTITKLSGATGDWLAGQGMGRGMAGDVTLGAVARGAAAARNINAAGGQTTGDKEVQIGLARAQQYAASTYAADAATLSTIVGDLSANGEDVDARLAGIKKKFEADDTMRQYAGATDILAKMQRGERLTDAESALWSDTSRAGGGTLIAEQLGMSPAAYDRMRQDKTLVSKGINKFNLIQNTDSGVSMDNVTAMAAQFVNLGANEKDAKAKVLQALNTDDPRAAKDVLKSIKLAKGQETTESLVDSLAKSAGMAGVDDFASFHGGNSAKTRREADTAMKTAAFDAKIDSQVRDAGIGIGQSWSQRLLDSILDSKSDTNISDIVKSTFIGSKLTDAQRSTLATGIGEATRAEVSTEEKALRGAQAAARAANDKGDTAEADRQLKIAEEHAKRIAEILKKMETSIKPLEDAVGMTQGLRDSAEKLQLAMDRGENTTEYTDQFRNKAREQVATIKASLGGEGSEEYKKFLATPEGKKLVQVAESELKSIDKKLIDEFTKTVLPALADKLGVSLAATDAKKAAEAGKSDAAAEKSASGGKKPIQGPQTEIEQKRSTTNHRQVRTSYNNITGGKEEESRPMFPPKNWLYNDEE